MIIITTITVSAEVSRGSIVSNSSNNSSNSSCNSSLSTRQILTWIFNQSSESGGVTLDDFLSIELYFFGSYNFKGTYVLSDFNVKL